jgi:hypothetical protein
MDKSGGVSREQGDCSGSKREYRDPGSPGAVFFNAGQT